ncbi:hypothetical protein [Schinkia azotoformans]|uniref:hypothetical protein n=1 Tax=Schinkia azotoformans TaxID=1454 RepID=UPI002DB7D1A4|nr:hypothetical protein [Schinkia azotoformans]MEC1715657.1 hypothetical protein [Schinkia azotoformans]MEC1742199.1 hypothetical protein [Schinkia azotoformans]MEC1744903.1 hypothetical protein [Schinkia azotoformans]MEC1757855.1 hypothetical protein [Schinkia azotoformans]MEC1766794.1 hypothetical protein [Schinkia azotoformans]
MDQNQSQKYEFLSEDPNVKTLPIMLSLIIGAFFAVLNETLLNITLTALMHEFHITLPTVQWMATGSSEKRTRDIRTIEAITRW